MNADLYERIMRQAHRIAEMYEPRVDKVRFAELVEVLQIFRKYLDEKSDDCDMLYDLIHGEYGIWQHSVSGGLPETEQQMWLEETCILSCMIWLEFDRLDMISPEDMEFRGENIPEYINFLEENVHSPDDFERGGIFWKDKMCY